MMFKKSCKVCNTIFSAKRDTQKYCSTSCRKKMYYNKFRKGTYEKHCIMCAKQYIASQPHEKYCSVSCQKQRHYRDNKESYRAYWKKIRSKNAARESLRRASIRQAIPKWIDFKLVEDIYKEAEYQQMQVDHIVPLISNKVCGLHWEGNLQLLTKHENVVKNNKQWPEMPRNL